MQQIGGISPTGFTFNDLNNAYNSFTNKGIKCEMYNLNRNLPVPKSPNEEDAYLFIARNGISALYPNEVALLSDEVMNQKDLVDKHAWMKGRVVNKIARWNLCYANESQEPDYENKKENFSF